MRDTFFASPLFPRLLNPEILRATIAEGVKAGKFGYVGKAYEGYRGLVIGDPNFGPDDVEFSDQVVLLPPERALALSEQVAPPPAGEAAPPQVAEEPGVKEMPIGAPEPGPVTPPVPSKRRISWEGELPPQKWTNFYMKVLTHFATDPSLRIRVRFEVAPEAGITQTQLEEIKVALKELGVGIEELKILKDN